METTPTEPVYFIARGFPRSFTEADIGELLAHFGIREIQFSKRRGKITAILTVRERVIADSVLTRLHQLRIGTARLSVEHYNRQDELGSIPLPTVPIARETAQELSNYVRALHVIHPVDFNQPPPPYLKYRYPKPTRDIIDSISVALESVPKFYVQVLHLMNRMNLPPPFTPKELEPRPDTRRDAAQQTDLTMIEESLLAEGESELESDEETHPKLPLKSKVSLIKNRFKPYVKPAAPKIVTPAIAKIIEPPKKPKPKPTPAITIHVPDQLPTKTVPEPISPELPPSPPPPTSQSSLTEQDLLSNQIPPDQLADLHVFKNYTPGAPSSKLYIKNLAKTVTEQNLLQIYEPFSGGPGRATISAKLMQSGRMKGQAFVTFSYTYPEDLEGLTEAPIERARRLTNGYILHNKPMVVCYAREEKVAMTTTKDE